MKATKTILAGAIALAFSSQAFADVTVYITGSSAFRGSAHAAIATLLGATTSGGNIQAAYLDNAAGDRNFGNTNAATFRGTVAGIPGTVTIKTRWTGSAAGVLALTGDVQPTGGFLADSVNLGNATLNTSGTPGASVTGGATAGAAPAIENHVADVAFSDVTQGTTPFKSPGLFQDKVGVIEFKWVASKDWNIPGGTQIDNVTSQLAQSLFGSIGELPLSVFTGDLTQRAGGANAAKVFAIGRDPDSGTRLTAFAESGLGTTVNVQQYQPTIASGAVTSQILWPAGTVNGLPVDEGNSGYDSGGNLATAMRASSFANTGGFYVTYLSVGDAATATNGGVAKELKYNGVPYSRQSVIDGTYTFWSYEWLMYRNNQPAGDVKTFADKLRAQIKITPGALHTTDLKVSRAQDGGVVTP